MRALVLALAASTLLSPSLAADGSLSALKKHDSNQQVDVGADRLEVRDKQNTAVFRGHVEATQGDLKIACDKVTVHYAAAEGTDRSVKRIDAEGGVRLTSPSETVTSKWAIYDLDAKLITLGGNVELTQRGNRLKGSRVELDLESGVTRVDGVVGGGAPQGRVTGSFTPPKKKN